VSMRRGPDFEDLVGPEVGGAERDRLLRIHELIVQAGPPPELPPHLEKGPTLGMTIGRKPKPHNRQRWALLAAAIVVLVLVFVGGYLAGSGKQTSAAPTPVVTLQMHGTKEAPRAQAALELLPEQGNNWPMTLTVTGLRRLPKNSFYEVYLVRSGKPWESCGTFVVRKSTEATKVTLNAPYRLHRGDKWVVTRQPPGMNAPGPTVMQQLA
jgi:hypothetical protein